VLLCNSDEDAEKERLYAEILSQERVAGVIVVPSAEACCRPLVEQGIPVVMVDRRVPGVQTDSVVLDNQAGGYQATKHLIGLGHSRIGLVSAPMHVSVGLERRQGYELALEEAGLPLDPSLVVEGNFKELGGYRAASALLALERRPTAIFAVNNLMTMGALKAMHEARLRIPDDISMVGFNDMPWLPLLQPPLTAICQPTYEIGTRAAQLLFHRLQGSADLPIEAVVLQPELIVRDSTAPPPRQSPTGRAGCATGVDVCYVT